MTFRYVDRVRAVCVPSGLGDINLSTSPLGYLSFADAGFSDGDTTVICCVVPVTGEFIVCEATYNAAGPSITRGTIILNHLGTTANVNFTGGSTGAIFCGLSASRAVHIGMTAAQLIAANIQPLPTTGVITATGTVQGDAASISTLEAYITAGAANTGVKLQSTATYPIGSGVLISNKTSTNKILYPDSGSNFDSDAADTGISLSPGQSMRVRRYGATQWYTS